MTLNEVFDAIEVWPDLASGGGPLAAHNESWAGLRMPSGLRLITVTDRTATNGPIVMRVLLGNQEWTAPK